MSFEGYYQFLCKDGHYWVENAHDTNFGDAQYILCPKCSEMMVWANLVDVTNGSWDENRNRIDGYVELEPYIEETCESCGAIIERRYKIPDE